MMGFFPPSPFRRHAKNRSGLFVNWSAIVVTAPLWIPAYIKHRLTKNP